MSQPAQNPAAEQAVLGAVLRSEGAVLPEVSEWVKAGDFYEPRHGLVFTAASKLFSQQDPVDANTVADELQREGNLVRVGGAEYLADLLEAIGNSANVSYYARSVAEAQKLRELGQLCTRGQQLVAAGGADYREVVDEFERFLDDSSLSNSERVQGFTELFEEWVQWQNTKLDALPTPWATINDKLAGGLHKQRLYIVAARPGCGKSILGLNISTQIALSGYKGMTFSLEMPKMEVMSRMLAAGAKASYSEVTQHLMTRETKDAIHRFAGMNSNFQSRVLIDDQTDHTLESIMSLARAQKRQGLDYVFIDYVQLLNSSRRFDARYEELGVMSKTLHNMARKLDIAVLLAAQAGRQQDHKDHIPTMSDLRESGNLEADADVVLMLSRGGNDMTPDMPLVTVSIVKNRTGVAPDVVRLPEHFEQARIGA